MKKTYFDTTPKKLPKYYTKEAIDKVFTTINHDTNKHSRRNYLMLLTLWRTGMRVSDLVHLHKSDIKEDTIVIHGGKGGKDRVLPLGYELRNLLLTYADPLQKDEILFKVKRRQVNNIIKRYDPGIHAHTFRHSFAVHYLKSGGNIRALQKILGHGSLTTTSIYLDLVGADVKQDYDKIVW